MLFTRSAGDRMTFGIRRGTDELTFALTVSERPHDFDRLTDLVDPEKSLVSKLGILAVDITEATASLAASVRVPSGVIVVGHTTNETESANAGLMTADTIHAINNQSVTSVDGLRAAVDALKPRAPVVLQIERAGQFMFLAFELD
jgi:S1-C subfamily serine protease